MGTIITFIFKIIEMILGVIFNSLFPKKVVYKNNFRKISNSEKLKALEKSRQLKGYKKEWLYYRCRDEGLLNEYQKKYGIIKNPSIKFNFGKYKGKIVQDIWKKDNDYCLWLLNSSRYSIWSSSSVTVYNELEKLNGNEDTMFFSFGKYRGKSVNEIWEKDNQYCLWLLDQDWAFEYQEVNYISEVLK